MKYFDVVWFLFATGAILWTIADLHVLRKRSFMKVKEELDSEEVNLNNKT